MDISKGIPDYNENRKYHTYNDAFLKKIGNTNTFGLRFDHNFKELEAYKQKNYNMEVKKFIDKLDEDQGIATELGLTALNLIGKTAIAITGLVPMVAGGVYGLMTWDSTKVFDNAMARGWDKADDWWGMSMSTYGGSDVWDQDEKTGEFEQKEWYLRMYNDPLKSLNADLAPAIAFVASTVLTETLMGIVTAASGGLAAPLLAANTARITMQGAKLFNKVDKLTKLGRVARLSKMNKLVRSIDKMDDARRLQYLKTIKANHTKGFELGVSAIRSSAWESSLIARESSDATVQEALRRHWEHYGVAPTEQELERYQQLGDDAGLDAYLINTPLVAFSNFVQMPRLFMKNMRMSTNGAKSFGKIGKGAGRISKETGVWKEIGNFESALRIGTGVAKGGVSEGFEEFSQGALQEGLMDYYGSLYDPEAVRSSVDLWNAVYDKSKSYLNTVEGRDSVSIGFVMGLVGLRSPIKTDSKTGKVSLGWGENHSGAIADVKDVVKSRREAKKRAEFLNDPKNSAQESAVFQELFTNNIRGMAFNTKMDEAASSNNAHAFKNHEHGATFNFIAHRHSLGLDSHIQTDLEEASNISIEKFNELYGTEHIQYSEEDREKSY